MSITKEKELGQTFTPLWVVNYILTLIGYTSQDILHKTILEPSCGDGAFLKEIVKRFIVVAKRANYTNEQIIKTLETKIYGIEIDKDLCNKCIENLNTVAKEFEIESVKWQILNADTLTLNDLPKFDFIIGNPPYVRLHNLPQNVRDLIKSKYSFCQSGTTDLYIAFYEFAIKNIKENGKVCFITPNSFLRNQSSKIFREFIRKNQLLSSILDFANHQVFDNVSTYTSICLLQNNSVLSKYYKYQNDNISFIKEVNLNDFAHHNWCFDMEKPIMQDIFTTQSKLDFSVKYGLATLRDKIYIADTQEKETNLVLFNSFYIEKDATKQIIKASLSNPSIQRIIYPYKKTKKGMETIQEEEFQELFPLCYKYLLHHKEELLKRDMDKNYTAWYQYGRSQALQSINQEKIIISGIAKDSVNMFFTDENTLTYSGMFLTSNNLEKIAEVIKSKKFLEYIHTVGKNMQGGYKSFNTAHIKHYLDNYL